MALNAVAPRRGNGSRLVSSLERVTGLRVVGSPLLRQPGAEAEHALLGALLLDGSAITRMDGLRAKDFGEEQHRIIFGAILDEAEDAGIVDLCTVSARLARNVGDGMAPYLASLAQASPGARHIERYAELAKAQAKRRQLAALGTEIAERAAASSTDVMEFRREILTRLDAYREPEKRAAVAWKALTGREAPMRRWAVKGWLGFGHTTLLVGAGGIGKSLLAQQIGSSLALGRPFIDDVSGPFKVLYWACEDDHDEIWRRQVSIAASLDAWLDAFAERLVIVPRHGLDNALVTSEYGKLLFTPLIEDLRQQAGDTGAEVVVLDNAAQLYGASENDRHAVTSFLNALAGALPGKAVLLLAHPARAAGSEFSGSSAWENVARTRLYLGAKLPDQKQNPDEDAQDDVRFLARRKANYSSKDWRRFTFLDGVLVPDAIDTQGGIVGHLRDQAAERVLLDGLRRLAEMGVTATDGTTSPRFLPRLMQDYKLSNGHGRAELAAAMRRLMLDGKLRRGEVGRDSYRKPVFGLMEVSA